MERTSATHGFAASSPTLKCAAMSAATMSRGHMALPHREKRHQGHHTESSISFSDGGVLESPAQGQGERFFAGGQYFLKHPEQIQQGRDTLDVSAARPCHIAPDPNLSYSPFSQSPILPIRPMSPIDVPSSQPDAPPEPPYEGACLCGGVRYRLVRTPPAQVISCQCSMCRKCSGAFSLPFGAWSRKVSHD